MAGCTHAGPLAAWQDADRVPAGPRAVGVGLRPRRHRPRGLAGCSPRCRRETARSAMVGPAKCMVKLRCAWSRWRAGVMRQGHEAPEVSPFHSRSLLAPAHLRGGTSSRVSHRVCGPRCRQVALLLGVCLVCAGSVRAVPVPTDCAPQPLLNFQASLVPRATTCTQIKQVRPPT